MQTVLVTGAKGFISGYLIQELLNNGYRVIGIDNLSKYGDVKKSYDKNPNYIFFRHDAKDKEFIRQILEMFQCNFLVLNAARIGGISYFHTWPYDIISENEKITAAGFDALIEYKKAKAIVLSSSMVFENAAQFPTKESHIYECPPPSSTYGFQKLAVEYFAKGAAEQYGLDYTLIRPFNCIGVGEYQALSDKEIWSGNIKLSMSHVVPDLVLKLVKGQNPLHILGDGTQIRHYTYGGDIAKGIRIAMESPKALGQTFNISTSKGHTVLELAKIIWYKLREDEFNYVSDPPFEYDVQKRIPDVTKAKEILGFEANTSLEWVLDNEIIPWIKEYARELETTGK